MRSKPKKILVVGSSHELEDNEVLGFQEACRAIGRALAQDGCEVIVGSDKPVTADKYIVEGIATVEDKSHRLWIIRPDYGRTPFAGSEAEKSGRIQLYSERLRGTWSAGRVPQILAADAVLVVGGGSGSLATGQVAVALQKPVLAVGSFGGAAKELWRDLAPFYRRLGGVSERMPSLSDPWKPGHPELIIETMHELVKRNPFRTAPRLPLGIYMGSLIILMAAWVGLFTTPPGYPAYPEPAFFGMLFVAGLLGTMLRTNLRLMNDPTSVFSWNELVLELGAGLILAFALALLYLVGAIAIKDASSPSLLPNSPEDFERVAVVMTLLGLGAGLMIEQAATRVRSWYVERLGENSSAGE